MILPPPRKHVTEITAIKGRTTGVGEKRDFFLQTAKRGRR